MPPELLALMGQSGGHIGGNLGNILSYFLTDPSRPYDKASDEMQRLLPGVTKYQTPFWEAGKAAIPQYQNWLSGMKDPSSFINNLMGQYQQSPGNIFLQNQAMRAAKNMGSASGLTGSTPLTQFAQQQASGIAQQGMNDWLNNVLGVNTQYGQGLFGEMGMGQNAASNLTDVMNQYMKNMAGLKYGGEAEKQKGLGGLISGIGGLFF